MLNFIRNHLYFWVTVYQVITERHFKWWVKETIECYKDSKEKGHWGVQYNSDRYSSFEEQWHANNPYNQYLLFWMPWKFKVALYEVGKSANLAMIGYGMKFGTMEALIKTSTIFAGLKKFTLEIFPHNENTLRYIESCFLNEGGFVSQCGLEITSSPFTSALINFYERKFITKGQFTMFINKARELDAEYMAGILKVDLGDGKNPISLIPVYWNDEKLALKADATLQEFSDLFVEYNIKSRSGDGPQTIYKNVF